MTRLCGRFKAAAKTFMTATLLGSLRREGHRRLLVLPLPFCRRPTPLLAVPQREEERHRLCLFCRFGSAED